MMSQFGASLTDDSRVVIYDRNVFIIQATVIKLRANLKVEPWCASGLSKANNHCPDNPLAYFARGRTDKNV